MSRATWPNLWFRTVGLLGLIAGLVIGLFAKGGQSLIPELAVSYRWALLPLVAGLLWCAPSLMKDAPYAKAAWWKGLFTVLFLAYCLHLLLNLRGLSMALPSPDVLKTVVAIGPILFLSLVYFFISHVLVSYASSRTHYDPSKLSGQEMVIGLTFFVLTLVMAALFVQKEGHTADSIQTHFSPLSLAVDRPTGYYRHGPHLIVASHTGLHHSYDEGKTWSLQAKAEGLLTSRVRKLYARADRLLLVLDSDAKVHGGMMESRDEGKTWQLLPYPKDGVLSRFAWQDLVCDRQGYCAYTYMTSQQHVAILAPNKQEFQLSSELRQSRGEEFVYVASEGEQVYRIDPTGLWHSQDGGKQWEHLSLGQAAPSTQDEQRPPLLPELAKESGVGNDKKDEHTGEEKIDSHGEDYKVAYESHEDEGNVRDVVGLRVKGEVLCLVERSSLKHSKDRGKHWEASDWYPEISGFVVFGSNGYGASGRGLAVFPDDCSAPKFDKSYGEVLDILDGQEQVLIVTEKGLFVSPLLDR